MAVRAQDITFVVPGQATPAGRPLTSGPGASSPVTPGTVKAAVRVSERRGDGETVRITARPGEDYVVLHIANGPVLFLHPEHARELMRAQVGAEPAARADGAPSVDGDVRVPAQLSWRGLDAPATRGGEPSGTGAALLDTVEVVGPLEDAAAGIVTAAAMKAIDGQVDPGVYQLSPDELQPLKGRSQKIAKLPEAPDGAPILVFAHGTFVDTSSTFAKFWMQHPALVRDLFQHYGGRVYALDHPTVGASPFANALTLAETLPRGARVHLVTHSRGGLVAEVLARIASGQELRPEDLAFFSGDGYSRHRADLQELDRLFRQQPFHVERVVRVACPARGTLLASRRLDAYLSVLKWCLELAGVPVAPDLVNFLAEIARRRTDPAEMPGLEAMMPDGPFAKWLNAAPDAVPGDLRVIAGDVEGDSLLTWVTTLLAETFYWTDNDLVVQTRSMYGGTPRTGGARFVLDRGGSVTHFNYFANDRTAGAVVNALVQDQPAGFRQIGPSSWAGEDSSGSRAANAAARSRTGSAGERPAVFVLPGILGSHLKVDGNRVWLSWRFINHLDQLKWHPAAASRVQPDGPVGMSYDGLIDFLGNTHEVVPFSFDWRRPMEDEARRLAEEIERSLTTRNATQQPVRIVAHSMGGLLLRTMLLERPETWKHMLTRKGARVLMLGTPNGGSWAPMQVLSGDDSFGNMMTAAGSLFDSYAARETIAGMPGLMQLQAGLRDAALELDKTDSWQRFADADLQRVNERVRHQTWWHKDPLQLEAYKWGVPPQPVLDKAVGLRQRLDAQRETLGADASKILLVVGKAPSTPAGIQETSDGIAYLSVSDGDGRVTRDSACLPGVQTWKTGVVHGDLANAKEAFEGYLDLLTRGDTSKLERLSNAGGADAPAQTAAVSSRPSRTARSAEPPAEHRNVFVTVDEPAPRLRMSVVNGNLMFVREPLMLGHYRSLKLTGSEAEVDRLLAHPMRKSLHAGLYPSAIGSHQVFVNTDRHADEARPEAVIVAGLGEEGTLRTTDLALTVRQATLAYSQRMSETGAPAFFDLAATLIGTGGIGVRIGTAAQAIAQGVSQANDRLRQVQRPVVANLRLIELYLDRATEAHHALDALAMDHTQRYELAPQVELREGALPRPLDSGYRGAGYDFITVERRPAAGQRGDALGGVIEFTLDTRRARNEVRGQATQARLVDELVRVGASDKNRNDQIGRSLFKLLVPVELEPFLSGSSSVLLQLDHDTAAYPWELLDTQGDDDQQDGGPWAVRTKMLRKLRTPEFRNHPMDARRMAGALVIGEPQCDPLKYPPLPAAFEEARAVAQILGVEPKLKLDALAVVNAVLDQHYRVIHIAGHGDFLGDRTGGVVLSNNTVLGPREIEAMRIVPELAFINCCYLGQMTAGLRGEKRPSFAANVAEQLIRIGVRCVVAAGWAVDDAPAKLFATCFYEALTGGKTFAEAVGDARAKTRKDHPGSNTWGAYQCYGDPDWRYLPDDDDRDAQMPDMPAAVAPADLQLELETLAARSRYRPNAREVRRRLEELDKFNANQWGSHGKVAETFGHAYAELNDFEKAIGWYERAVGAEDGRASMRASEQLGNLQARVGAGITDPEAARTKILAAIERLERLLKDPTSERASLVGSAYKRLAMLEAAEKGMADDFRKAVDNMAKYYGQAEKIAREKNSDDLFYPASNCVSAELIRGFRSKEPDARNVDKVQQSLHDLRRSLRKKTMHDADFWSIVGMVELRIYEALADRKLAEAVDGIVEDLADVKARASAPHSWASVRDHQAKFVLPAYIKARSIPPAEHEAARKLLARLEDYAKT
jgi:tetratricopeptide (TPR) repeat protein